MQITDLDGKEIIITDLPIAILQADDYRHYRVSKPLNTICIYINIGKIFI